jgi:hypothetical protein
MWLQITTVDGTDFYYYMNETSVGQGGQNKRRSDIQLVQFFLNQFYIGHPELFKLLPSTGSGAASVDIDGQVGLQTIEGIRQFQINRNVADRPAVVDGKVSVAQGDVIPGTNTEYTIHRLNLWFFTAPGNRESNAQWKGNLHSHPAIAGASELQAELAAIEAPVPSP